MQQSNYTLVEQTKLDQISEQKGFVFFDQIDFNLAYVYKKDNEYMVFPQEGKNAVWFHNSDAYEKAVKEKEFPEEEEPLNNFHRDKEVIYAFDFDSIICNLVNKEIIHEKEDYTHEDFELISKKLNVLKKQNKLTDQIFYELGFFLSECFRKKVNGNWELQARYSINLYWFPHIRGDKNEHLFGTFFWKSPSEQKIINIEQILLMNVANYLKIPVLSKKHAHFLQKKWEDIIIN